MEKQLQQIFLIRHGETEWSLNGKHTGKTDIPLTENGQKMAQQIQSFFKEKEIALTLTSPLKRARMTCELAGFGNTAKIDQDLLEWNYGEFEGLTSKEIQANFPDWNLFENGCPGGESPEQVKRRVDRVIEKIRDVNGNVILFAHGHILRTFAVRWLNLPISEGNHFILDPATLCVMTYSKNEPAMKVWNAAFY